MTVNCLRPTANVARGATFRTAIVVDVVGATVTGLPAEDPADDAVDPEPADTEGWLVELHAATDRATTTPRTPARPNRHCLCIVTLMRSVKQNPGPTKLPAGRRGRDLRHGIHHEVSLQCRVATIDEPRILAEFERSHRARMPWLFTDHNFT